MYIVHVHVHVHVCIVCCALREARQPKVAAPENIARGTLVKKTRPLHAAGNRTLLQQEKAYAPVMSIGLCVGTHRSSVMCSTGFWGSKQNRIAVWAPTKPPARNGQFAKTFLGDSTLTLACARHAAFAPAHGISQK